MTTLLGKGGGPTAVIAQSLVGAILRARLLGTTARIYGALHGVQGIVNQDFVDLTDVPEEDLELVAKNPGAQLRSTRDKPDQVYCANILRVLQAHRISSFLYIGGNDTSETLRILSTQAAAIGYDLTCVHVPKTIDNDLGPIRGARLHGYKSGCHVPPRRVHRSCHGSACGLAHGGLCARERS